MDQNRCFNPGAPTAAASLGSPAPAGPPPAAPSAATLAAAAGHPALRRKAGIPAYRHPMQRLYAPKQVYIAGKNRPKPPQYAVGLPVSFPLLIRRNGREPRSGTTKPFQQFGAPSFPDSLYHFIPQTVPGAFKPPLLSQTCYGLRPQRHRRRKTNRATGCRCNGC